MGSWRTMVDSTEIVHELETPSISRGGSTGERLHGLPRGMSLACYVRPMSNRDDEIRDAILRHLFAVHRKAKSPRSAGQGIKELQSALKGSVGYKQQEVSSNLDYLVQKKWVRQEIESRSFTTQRGTTQMAEKVTYKISDVGIDHLQGASMYERVDLHRAINITNVRGVTVVGSGNVVNTSFTDLSRTLTELRAALIGSDALDDETKLSAAADIDTIATQIQKPVPDGTIVERAWDAVQKAAAFAGLAEAGAHVAHLLAPLLH
jgi:hypothetical protein